MPGWVVPRHAVQPVAVGRGGFAGGAASCCRALACTKYRLRHGAAVRQPVGRVRGHGQWGVVVKRIAKAVVTPSGLPGKGLRLGLNVASRAKMGRFLNKCRCDRYQFLIVRIGVLLLKSDCGNWRLCYIAQQGLMQILPVNEPMLLEAIDYVNFSRPPLAVLLLSLPSASVTSARTAGWVLGAIFSLWYARKALLNPQCATASAHATG